jgi:long-chain acyl-CoA synthetase
MFGIGIPVVEGYGLTETSPVIAVNPLDGVRLGSVGRPIPGVEVTIDEGGEILTRGPIVMRGYYRNEAATAEALRGGWFHTGDVGRLDKDGYLFITDRLKDLLVLAGGKKVAPQPIETRLKQGRWIGEAVLLGDRRPYVVALLVPNFANVEAEAKLKGWSHADRTALVERPEVQGLFDAEVKRVNAELAQFEQIKRFTVLDREFTQEGGELTPSLKVKRRVVEERLAPAIEQLYAGHALPAA